MRLALMGQASVRTPSGGAAAGCVSQRSEPEGGKSQRQGRAAPRNRDRGPFTCGIGFLER